MRYFLDGLDCAHCADKIEKTIQRIEGLNSVSVNFATKSVELPSAKLQEVQAAVEEIEPGIQWRSIEDPWIRCEIEGLDCTACAGKIEAELQKHPGLETVSINFATRSINIPSDRLHEAQRIIHGIEPGVQLRNEQASEKNNSSDGQRLKLVISAMLFFMGFFFHDRLHATTYAWAEYVVLLPAYLMMGWPVMVKAGKKILKGQFFDENFLMTIATLGALAIHQWTEAVGVMLFYAVGIYLQERALGRSRRSIQALLDIQPEYANIQDNGSTRRVRPDEVVVGQMIRVRPGEKIPLDGVVLEGESFIDTSALTGESTPRRVRPNDGVLAGMINREGMLSIRVEKPYHESSVSRILQLVEKAGERKAPIEQFITVFARFYTPVVVTAAVLVAVVPPLFFQADFTIWLHRALVLLVISCPCALMVSIPLGYFGGIGGSSRQGILVKGANYLDALNSLHTVVFDKTGTLTQGTFRVMDVVARNGFSSEEILEMAAYAEAHSNHPIAQSIREAWDGVVDEEQIGEYLEIPAHGILAVVKGQRVLAGNDRLMQREDIVHEDCQLEGTIVYIATGGQYAGYIVISDEVRPDAAETIKRLRVQGVKRILMLTGDEESVARRVSEELDLDGYCAGLLPEEKVNQVEGMLASLPNPRKQRLAFVGDGVNDAPVIVRADIGVAMGGLGSDAAIEAADIVLVEDAPSKLSVAMEIAGRTRKIVRQNIIMALAVKGFFIVLGAAGVASIWEAVFADVGVTLLAVFNAMRTSRR